MDPPFDEHMGLCGGGNLPLWTFGRKYIWGVLGFSVLSKLDTSLEIWPSSASFSKHSCILFYVLHLDFFPFLCRISHHLILICFVLCSPPSQLLTLLFSFWEMFDHFIIMSGVIPDVYSTTSFDGEFSSLILHFKSLGGPISKLSVSIGVIAGWSVAHSSLPLAYGFRPPPPPPPLLSKGMTLLGHALPWEKPSLSQVSRLLSRH